jgi:putative glutamine transport system permease protein
MAAFMYFVVNYLLSILARRLEKRLDPDRSAAKQLVNTTENLL